MIRKVQCCCYTRYRPSAFHLEFWRGVEINSQASHLSQDGLNIWQEARAETFINPIYLYDEQSGKQKKKSRFGNEGMNI